MAIHRGIQSAIFYYVSCAPCAEARVRKQRKEEAKRDRAARLALEEELPNLYRHPSPSSTNPHWHTEIALGPTLAARGRRKTNGGAAKISGNTSGVPSSVNLPPGSSDGRNDSKFNLRQREDEELWGSTTCLGGTNSNDGLRRPPTARTTDSSKTYRTYRNPAINDLHPATVTRVTSRDEVLWMMQPPPVAEIMSGKQPASSSRSTGGTSRASRRSPNVTPLSVALSDRIVDNNLKTGSPPSLGLSRQNSSRLSDRAEGQRHDGNSTTWERDFAFPQMQQQSSRDKRAFQIDSSQESADSSLTTLRRPSLGPESLRRPSQSMRPPLSTVTSDSLCAEDSAVNARRHAPSETPANESAGSTTRAPEESENSPPLLRLAPPPNFLIHEHSLKIAQDLSPGPGAVLNAKIYAASSPDQAGQGRRARLPSHDENGGDSDAMLGTQPEIFEKLQAPEFELPEWVHEHTKRDGVKERWSMDF